MRNLEARIRPAEFSPTTREVVDVTVARNAYYLSIMFLIASVPTIALFAYFGLQSGAPQLLTIAATMFVASFGAVAAVFLIPRDRAVLAMMIIITAFIITFFSIPFLIQGLGIVLALSLFMIVVAISGLAMPARYSVSGLVVALLAAVLILLLDYVLLPSQRLQVPALSKFTPLLLIGFAIFFTIFTARQFRRFSLRVKIALAILMTGGLTVAAILTLGLSQVNKIVDDISARYGDSSTAGIELKIRTTVESEASQTDEYFSALQTELSTIAKNRASLESQKAAFSIGTYWDAHTRIFPLAAGQYTNASSDVASIFIPSNVVVDEGVMSDLNTTAYLDFSAPNFLKSQPDVAAVYYISANGAITHYPNINLAAKLASDFDATAQPFYTIALPVNNPKREPRWTEVYQDPAGNGLITTLSIPVYAGEQFIGVVGMDLQLEKISQTIADIKLGETGYAFLVDQSGHLVAMPSAGYVLYGVQPEIVPMNESPKLSIMQKGPADLQEATAKLVRGKSGISTITINNSRTYLAYAPLETPNYRLAVLAPQAEFTKDFNSSLLELLRTRRDALQGIAILLAVLLVLAIIVSLWVGEVITRPLVRLTQTAETIAQGDFSARALVESRDETGTLAGSFNSMAERLNDTLLSLEKRVSDRTQELETANEGIVRRAAQFESIAGVARTISSTQTLEALLPQIVQTISQQFGFYHVGIFLIDTHREYAILTAANSDGGKRMLERNHRLLVGGSGIVGVVASSGQPRLALDVGQDAAFFNNPDLPETHSEIALPLRIGQEIIGALDVQSREVNAFSEEDVNILSTLADQVSIAIQNARSYQQSREALAQADAASKQMSEQQWSRFTRDNAVNTYTYDGLEIKSSPAAGEQNGSGLIIPLLLRGTQIGTLRLDPIDPNRSWSEDELAMAQATAERTALAIEGARLLQEAQKRAAKERTIGEISAKIGSLVSIENILQTAIQELGNTMPNTDIAIQFEKDLEAE